MKAGIRILVGIDGSSNSKTALLEAINLSRVFSGSLKVITVYELGKESEAKKLLEEAKTVLEREKIEYGFLSILGSNPSEALVNTALNEDCDLIVIGSRGLGRTASFLLGSVSRRIVTKAHCNVLVVK